LALSSDNFACADTHRYITHKPFIRNGEASAVQSNQRVFNNIHAAYLFFLFV